MRVCNLVTNERARFYDLQLDALGRHGVDHETVAIGGKRGADGRTPLAYGSFYLRALRASLGEFDLVHANYGLTGPPAVLQPRHPVVLSLWGTDLFGRYEPVSRFCARHSDAVIVMSPGMAEALDTPCEVIPHGVDLDVFRPADRTAARERVGWPTMGHQVLFPYPPDRPVKNYPRAQQVVAAARDRLDAPVELRTVQGVPHDRMPDYMNAADALLLTSDHEGSPNAVKEAMACNLPVVATDVGDVAERLDGVTPSSVSDRDQGLVDGLVAALEGGRSDGREAAREVSVERMGERLIDVYRRVLDGQ
ncbi:glycosyltransferase [Haloglomus litoreum]|uniref:glycosyltransferase n=1 Tax=Haloglomus litoreum TaxID=3034026 RepID=UPI0023E8E795|nr:glycosyltransferase [Haloglomus sp. DT116]